MTKVIRLNRGFDIKIAGPAKKHIDNSFRSRTFALKPTDFRGIAPIPKLEVAVGDEVKAGDPIFYDKKNPDIHYCSPVSGEVVDVIRGPKRAIHEVVILADSNIEYRPIRLADPNGLSREELTRSLLGSGLWPMLRRRPFGTIALPEDDPKGIFISGFDTAPLAPDYDFMIKGHEQAFQKGIDILGKLTSGKVHLSLNAGNKPADAFNFAKNVDIHWFDGKHPVGNTGIQIHHIAPIRKGEVVWDIRPMDVVAIGRYFLEGKFIPERIVAITGPEVKRPRYVKTLLGASVENMVKDNLHTDHVRVISGDVLTGTKVAMNGHLGFHDNQITVIMEGDQPEMFGWLLPAYPRPSATRTFVPLFNEADAGYRVNTNTHGEERALVVSGQYENVLPMDLYPVHLIKAIMARDFDLMEGLGIYEVLEEDMALCEFACASKVDVQEILREGLDFMHEQS